ncbi:hypothetical protein KTN00_12165 [Acinetobacter soli]|uniref:hypothetical protein n=1 Tax=Acinetobacter soli TaxID=487316 RepID=UPI001C4816F5|nr:hypothetical protein [Acinetobacter soli]MBV6551770.1 hypothetical protein [Acinetobacter soli]
MTQVQIQSVDVILEHNTDRSCSYDAVGGVGSTFTYQIIGNAGQTAQVYGSNNNVDWQKLLDVTLVSESESSISQHTFKYLKAEGDAKVLISRG